MASSLVLLIVDVVAAGYDVDAVAGGGVGGAGVGICIPHLIISSSSRVRNRDGPRGKMSGTKEKSIDHPSRMVAEPVSQAHGTAVY